jgi:hypothetical protein
MAGWGGGGSVKRTGEWASKEIFQSLFCTPAQGRGPPLGKATLSELNIEAQHV